jgi:23S rRNA pseudouridine1911/1915/1917 synthase
MLSDESDGVLDDEEAVAYSTRDALPAEPNPIATFRRFEFTYRKDNGVAKRLDQFLVGLLGQRSRSDIQRIIEAGGVVVNGQPGKSNRKVRPGDLIVVEVKDAPDPAGVPEDIPLTFVYEDEFMAVINKSANMIVHPGRGKDNWHGTLVNALQFHFDNKLSHVGDPGRPGIVHRLDRDTTGVIVVAKDDLAHRNLALQFENRQVEKEYLAIVYGVPDRDADYIEKKIGRHPGVREKMAIRPNDPDARDAVTFYEVIERFKKHALIRCKPKTGRTHQIRVHLDSIGLPIVADKPYSGRTALKMGEIVPNAEEPDEPLIARQALHAHRLKIRHPRIHDWMEFMAPLPADMARVLEILRQYQRP